MTPEEFIKHGQQFKDHKNCPVCNEWYLREISIALGFFKKEEIK